MQNNCSTFNIPRADFEPVDIFAATDPVVNEVSDIYTAPAIKVNNPIINTMREIFCLFISPL